MTVSRTISNRAQTMKGRITEELGRVTRDRRLRRRGRAAAYVIDRLNIQHADRIAVHRYSAALPGRRGTPQPPVGRDRSESPTTGERRDHRDGGRGRFPPRRSRTTHHR